MKVRKALMGNWLASMAPDGYVFPTRRGARQDPHNIRSRVVARAVERASENLVAAGEPPLPERITPHSLRRAFCSLLYALGEEPGVVMDEMGHTDPGLALRVSRQAMRRDEDEENALRALVDGAQLADIGILGDSAVVENVESASLSSEKPPR